MFLNANADKKTEIFGNEIGIGAKLGLNFNKITGEEWLQTYKTNPSLGFFAFINKKRYGFQFEALWSLNTMVSDSNFYGLYKQYYNISLDSLTQGTFNFHTISIPILFNYKITQWFWLQVGPQYTSLASVVDKDNLIKSGQTIIRTGEVSAVAGIWLNVGKVGPIPRINVGARYIAGISDINALSVQGNNWKNQRLQFHIGLGY